MKRASLLLVLSASCLSTVNPNSGYRFACDGSSACPSGQLCVANLCTATVDGGTDAGSAGGTDGGLDAGLNAGLDAGVDAGPDVGNDAGSKADGGLVACSSSRVLQTPRLLTTTDAGVTGVGASGMVSGDFNEDGFLDVVVTNTDVSSYSVLLNDHDGGFVISSYPTPVPCDAVATLLLDPDQHLDLAMVSFKYDSVVLLKGNGDGTFGTPNSVPLLPGEQVDAGVYGPSAILAADFNGDHRDDLVILDETSNDVRIWLSFPDGGLQPSQTLTLPMGFTIALRGMAAGDINRDSYADLVLASSGGDLFQFLSTGKPDSGVGSLGGVPTPLAGVASDHPTCPYRGNQAVTLVDLNGDGWLDALSAEADQYLAVVFMNDGAGSLQVSNASFGVGLTDGGGPSAIAVADFNGDGILDIATANGEGFWTGGGQVCAWPPDDYGNTLSLLLGLPDGGYADPMLQVLAESAPGSLLAATMNRGQSAQSLLVSFQPEDGSGGGQVIYFPSCR